MGRYIFPIIVSLFLGTNIAEAQLSIAPYASIKSTKSIDPSQNGEGTEGEKINQRHEFGIRGALEISPLFSFQLGIGQSVLKYTEKAGLLKDEYDKIDFQEELNVSADNPDADLRMKETQRVGQASLLFDPSFYVFIFRFKLGITAMQRDIEKDEVGEEPVKITDGPIWGPHSGLGIGVQILSDMYFMVEYEVFHYKFPPDLEPFERQLTISYSVGF